jgi:hypothetical protein
MGGQSLADTTGVDFLNTCHQLHPAAKRLLLITYGDIATGRAGVRAMALGLLDDFLNKPWGDPELELYPVKPPPTSRRRVGSRLSRVLLREGSFRSYSASEPGLRWPQAPNRWQSG